MPLPTEPARRRPGFVPGEWIVLADGEPWSFPGPLPRIADPGYEPILAALLDAEDEPDRLRAELAMAIFLLGINYELTPEDYQALLRFQPEAPALLAAQESLHFLALKHLQARPPSAGLVPAPVEPGADAPPVGPWSRIAEGWRRAWRRLLGRAHLTTTSVRGDRSSH